jgi:uncharacterized membrane protein (DUF441 family)
VSLKKSNYVDIVIVVVVGFVVFNLIPIDKIFKYMSKSTTNYLIVVITAAIICAPSFIIAKKRINKFEKNKWDKR